MKIISAFLSCLCCLLLFSSASHAQTNTILALGYDPLGAPYLKHFDRTTGLETYSVALTLPPNSLLSSVNVNYVPLAWNQASSMLAVHIYSGAGSLGAVGFIDRWGNNVAPVIDVSGSPAMGIFSCGVNTNFTMVSFNGNVFDLDPLTSISTFLGTLPGFEPGSSGTITTVDLDCSSGNVIYDRVEPLTGLFELRSLNLSTGDLAVSSVPSVPRVAGLKFLSSSGSGLVLATRRLLFGPTEVILIDPYTLVQSPQFASFPGIMLGNPIVGLSNQTIVAGVNQSVLGTNLNVITPTTTTTFTIPGFSLVGMTLAP